MVDRRKHNLAHMGPVRRKPVEYVPTVPFDQCCIVRYSPFLDTEEVVAKRDIAAGTWIDGSAPVWIFVDNATPRQSALLSSFNEYAHHNESEIAYSSNLMPQFHPPMTRAYWIEQMWLTNCWKSFWDTRQTVTSVANGSKYNHSCDSNLHVHVDHTQFRARAVCDISEGEILTVSYMGNAPIQQNLEERREYLQNWNFHCMCTRCEIEETLWHVIDQLEQTDLTGQEDQTRM